MRTETFSDRKQGKRAIKKEELRIKKEEEAGKRKLRTKKEELGNAERKTLPFYSQNCRKTELTNPNLEMETA